MSAARFDLPRRLLAEALGTAFLLATVVGSGIMAEKLAGGNVALALLCNTIPTGAILVVLITILGPVSGAHLNPAVSAALALRRELPRAELIAYVLAQFAGGVCGSVLAHGMFELPLVQLSLTARTGPGQWLGEITAAFGLLLTIFGGVRFRPAAVPWCVGLYIAAAYWFTSSTSFANPAVTVARGLSDTFAARSSRAPWPPRWLPAGSSLNLKRRGAPRSPVQEEGDFHIRRGEGSRTRNTPAASAASFTIRRRHSARTVSRLRVKPCRSARPGGSLLSDLKLKKQDIAARRSAPPREAARLRAASSGWV